jgi:5-methylcytosine-specific restriction endonuclease McrA
MKRKSDLRELFNIQSGHCFYCDKKMDLNKTNSHDAPTRDHFVAKHHGGSNHPHNLVCACHECNSRKGHMSGAIFMAIICKRHIRAVT